MAPLQGTFAVSYFCSKWNSANRYDAAPFTGVARERGPPAALAQGAASSGGRRAVWPQRRCAVVALFGLNANNELMPDSQRMFECLTVTRSASHRVMFAQLRTARCSRTRSCAALPRMLLLLPGCLSEPMSDSQNPIRRAAADGTLFKDSVVRLYPPGQALPYHTIGAGDVVLLSKGAKPDDDSIEGVVVDAAARWLRVALPVNVAARVAVSFTYCVPFVTWLVACCVFYRCHVHLMHCRRSAHQFIFVRRKRPRCRCCLFGCVACCLPRWLQDDASSCSDVPLIVLGGRMGGWLRGTCYEVFGRMPMPWAIDMCRTCVMWPKLTNSADLHTVNGFCRNIRAPGGAWTCTATPSPTSAPPPPWNDFPTPPTPPATTCWRTTRCSRYWRATCPRVRRERCIHGMHAAGWLFESAVVLFHPINLVED